MRDVDADLVDLAIEWDSVAPRECLPERRLCAAVLMQVACDLESTDPRVCLPAWEFVAMCGEWFVFFASSIGFDPRALRTRIMVRFADRIAAARIVRNASRRSPGRRPLNPQA